HVVRQLGEGGRAVVVVDNLSTGFEKAVVHGTFIAGDVGDRSLMDRVLGEHGIDTVMHFAAHSVVPESVRDPLKYYGNNTCKTRTLLEACTHAGVTQFVFSSTAAVYGIPTAPLAREDSPTCPINPYGTSKLVSEWMLRDAAAASRLRYVILRYFNVAGSDPEGRIGQSTREATLLIKVAAEVALGKRAALSVFGTDYPTLDGTGIRDYIHVDDLACAHLRALDYLARGGEPVVLNCGYGHGYSVREVIRAIEKIHGQRLNVREEPRRAGDPPTLVAGADRIRSLLAWHPRYDDLEFIVKTSLDWEQRRFY
ncbi:MAG: UDP-glucose 4-epimerase GalE, partial [Burkholderiales bacterium]